MSITHSMTIIPASFRDKDRNDPPELGWNLALVPDGLDERHHRLPNISGAYICLPLLLVLLQLCPFEPPFQVLRPHPRHSHAAAIGQLCDRSSNFLLTGDFIPDFGTHLCVVEVNGEARRVAPLVELNTLCHPPFFGLETRPHLCFRGLSVPPCQVPESLMDVPLGKLGDN